MNESQAKFWAKIAPNSRHSSDYDEKHGTNISGQHSENTDLREAAFRGGDPSAPHGSLPRDVWNAKWGNGPLAGRTGSPFIDDPFFNPWAPGGDFNK